MVVVDEVVGEAEAEQVSLADVRLEPHDEVVLPGRRLPGVEPARV